MNSDLKALIKRAKDVPGIKITQTANNHIQFSLYGVPVATASPRNLMAHRMVARDLRKAGVIL